MARPELNINPEANVKKLKKRIPPFLNRHRSVKEIFSPAPYLLFGLVLGTVPGACVYVDNELTPKNNAEVDRQLEQIPEISFDKFDAALKETQAYEEQSKTLAQQGKIDQIPDIFDSQSLKASYELVDAYSKRQKIELRKYPTVGPVVDVALGAVSVLGLGIFSLGVVELLLGEKVRSRKDAVNALLTIRPDWKEKTPTNEELMKFCRGLSYLPPVGGKIPLIIKGGKADTDVKKIDPSLTAEQQSKQVIEMRQKNELGDAYVHQLTVQGRLPDRFKFAAIALILNSPYGNDWVHPSFQAPWGQVAPLVHDGGNVRQNMGPLWHKVKGRTDFLERTVRVYATELEQNETLDVTKIAHLPNLSNLQKEQAERNRLVIEVKAYQRLALAAHAMGGTAPQRIPQDMRVQLAEEWKRFEVELSSILNQYGINGVAGVKWFRDNPVNLGEGWPGLRYEAAWEPIRAELIRLESAKKSNPEIQKKVSGLLVTATNSIDKVIGLL